ncbi:MAG: hypothetical protein EAZ42_10715 [Verrucomicrobia bacterium]|nr:MAG: hypothetical protein EAZ42_10715 [Verrucomicrobiota bacterium]
MIHLKFLLSVLAICAFSLPASAQISANLKLERQEYLAGEPVLATVTITNLAGRDLTFAGNGRIPWLIFILKDRKGGEVHARPNRQFGKMTIKNGQTVARKVDLSEHFFLTEAGNFNATASIRVTNPNAEDSGFSTNRVLFNQSPGRLYWSQTVGTQGGKKTRNFRVLNFTGDLKNQLYAQILDGASGKMVRTFRLGEVIMMRKPTVTIDGKQRMHVMFLATPDMYVHCVVDADGRLVDRGLHQRGAYGDPQLVASGTGNVGVINSIPFDPKAAAEENAKIRKASDRPSGGF